MNRIYVPDRLARMRRVLVLICNLALFAAAAGLTACGSSGGGKTSAAALSGRLMPASFVPGFHQQRTFDWSDPVNLVGEGLALPEASRPSDAVKAVRKAGLKGAAGERLTKGSPPNEDQFTVGVVKAASEAKATGLRDWMHAQDLQQPCFSECIFSGKAIGVPGVPSGVAVSQVPSVPPPPHGARAPAGGGPPARYFVEFTVGPYLYFAQGDGAPKDQARILEVVRRYYQRVSAL